MDNKVLLAVAALGAVGLGLYAYEATKPASPALPGSGPSPALPQGGQPVQPARSAQPAQPGGATPPFVPGVAIPGNIPSVPNLGLPNPLSLPGASPSSPEFQAAQAAAQSLMAQFGQAGPSSTDNSPEAQAARSLLSAFPASGGVPATPADTASPEAQAALGFLNSLGSLGVGVIPAAFQPSPDSPTNTDPVINVGDVVNVDMFKSGMNVPQNVPLVGLIFMNVDGLTVPGDTFRDKFVASFVSPEFRVLGQQTVNRNAIVSKV